MSGIRGNSQLGSAWIVCLMLSCIIATPSANAYESLPVAEVAAGKTEAARAFNRDAYTEAFRILDRLVAARDVDALAWSGFMHLLGLGVDIDPALGLKQLQSAARLGNAPAARYLFWIYDKGAGVAADVALAAHYRTIAHQNASQSNPPYYGWLNLREGEFASNHDRAVRWNLAQAQEGIPRGMYNTGYILIKDPNKEDDFAEGMQWLFKAAELEHPKAEFWAGTVYEDGVTGEQNYDVAVKYYLSAASQGHLGAQAKLGMCYAKGQGVEQDDKKAVQWFRQAAIRGNLDAQGILARWYRIGRGVERDFNQAVHWYEYAAEGGDITIKAELGYLYLVSELVDRNVEKGMQLLFEAADQGSVLAHYYLGVVYQNGVSVEPDYAEATHYFKVAADAGIPDAQSALAINLAKGAGVEQDLEEANRLLHLAAEKGDPRAEFALALWYYNGFIVSKDIESARKWITRAAEHDVYEAKRVLENGKKSENGLDAGFERYITVTERKLKSQNYIRQNEKLAESLSNDEISVPHPIHVVVPNYPRHLARKNIKGMVKLLVDIDTKGKVVDAKVEESFHPDVEDPALKAIYAWRFTPATKNGEPVPIQIRVPLRF